MNCLATPTHRTGEPEAPARASVSERFRPLKWNEVVWSEPGDRLKAGGRVWFSVPDDLSLEEFTTFCSSFSAGADKRSTTSVSTAKSLADDATCEPTSCASSSFGAAKRSYTLTTSSICENGSARSGCRTGIGRSLAAVAWQAGPRSHRKSAALRAGTCEFWISTNLLEQVPISEICEKHGINPTMFTSGRRRSLRRRPPH
jgi:hypothetical protein